MAEYTLTSLVLVCGVVAIELLWARSGIFRSAQYWLAMLIVMGFQIPVDGWLTRLDRPTVIYHPDQMLGARWPLDIPVEDFAFGFAMVTLALIAWTLLRRPVERSATSPRLEKTRNDAH